jgi:uncharacterized protein YjiS (DUF1127 family)
MGLAIRAARSHVERTSDDNPNRRRLRAEIAGLTHAEALDLGIFPGDADRIARQAVWG